jgi:hypothetical protein
MIQLIKIRADIKPFREYTSITTYTDIRLRATLSRIL